MKSFKEFLAEAHSFDLEKFKQDCAFFFEETDFKKDLLLYHGTKNEPADYEIRTFKYRNGPRDTAQAYHDAANAFFEKKFSEPIRDWMFVTGDKLLADNYSAAAPCVIFPIGEFNWVMAPSLPDYTDFSSSIETQTYTKALKDGKKRLTKDEICALTAAAITKQLERMTWIKDVNLAGCIKNGNEIMLKCDKFYIVYTKGEAFKQIETILR